MPGATPDWLNILDLPRAAYNCRQDMVGDWYRDPWGWPEVGFVEKAHQEIVVRRLNSTGVRRSAILEVAKENFATRPAIIMEPVDRLIYQALVDLISKRCIGSLRPWAHGWRLYVKNPQSGVYARNDDEWDNYRRRLKLLVGLSKCGLKTDIVSCFSSIPVDRLLEEVERRAGTNAVTKRLANMVEAWSHIPGRPGIPQRSAASAVLANMYLDRLDQAMQHYSNEKNKFYLSAAGGSVCTRWMDDIWVFDSDPSKLRRLQVELQGLMRDAGLNMNMGKTDVLEGEALAQDALKIEHSAVDQGLSENNPTPLEELIDQLLEIPEHADRTSIRFSTKRMRENRTDSRLRALVENAPRLPQGSDHLARTFRDFMIWEELQEWYLDYVKSDWASVPWSVAQFGTMFPSKGAVSKALRDHFAKTLQEKPPLPEFALCCQRLAAWDNALAREAMRSVLPKADHPLERRLLGLALLAASEERAVVRSVLGEYEENNVTLELIKARSFRAVKAVPDFSAD